MTQMRCGKSQWTRRKRARSWTCIDRWVARELKPIVSEYDHADRYPHGSRRADEGARPVRRDDQRRNMAASGCRRSTYAKIVMSISSVWMSITGIINSHLMLALAIEKFGTPQQKTRWLPKLATGEIRGGLALTEPDAGTDLQGIRMTARARRRSLRHQRHQDLDHQRRRRLVPSRCWSRPIPRRSRATTA